jgi:exopolyphosphatase / guanosine-5'-triphosphate,3'-diphosphate pyrophosphatase
MRVAAVDIGTNSVLLLVAEVDSVTRCLTAICERATVTRLGEGVDRNGVLADAAVMRTNACLAEYAHLSRSYGATRVAIVGTSALRDASGGETVSQFVKASFGSPLRIISGREEARLTFLGATSGLTPPDNQRLRRVTFDVGGGSTEIVLGERGPGLEVRLEFAESYDIGSVRLTERHIRNDPPLRDELEATTRAAAKAFAEIPWLASEGPPIGIAGTVTTLAAIALKMESYDGARVHGQRMALGEVERIVAKLASLSVTERKTIPGLHPGRADVIVAGGLIVLAALRQLGAKELQVSDRGLRWGLAMELSNPGE